MVLQKRGYPEKILQVMSNKTGALGFDPNLLVKLITDKLDRTEISLDELHEAAKSAGVVDYSSDDMNHVIELLQSSGITVSK